MKQKTWSKIPGSRKTLIMSGIPVSLVLLNLILKLIFAGHRDIALDEPFTIFYAQAGFGSLFEMLKTENNPPLHFIILHFWIKLFGISAFSVRFPSVLFSAATVYFIYRTGKDHFSLRTGIIASLIFTFSNYQMQYAHEARVYSLFGFLTVLSFFLFLRIYANPGKKGLTAVYLITLVLLVYSHFFGWIVIFIHFLCCLLIKEFRKKLMRIALMGLLVPALFYLPYIFIFFSRLTQTVSHGTWVPAPVVSDLYTMVWRFSNAPVTTVCFLLSLAAACFIFFLRREQIRDIRPATATILVWFFVPYILMFLVSFLLPVFLDRYVIFLSFAFYMLVAYSVDYSLREHRFYYPAAFIVVLLAAVTFTPDTDNQRRIKEATVKIRELKKENTLLFICPGWLDLGVAYYYDPAAFKDYNNFALRLNRDHIYPVNSADQIDTAMIKKAKDVLYFEEWSSLVDREQKIHSLFDGYFPSHETYRFRESYILTHYYNP